LSSQPASDTTVKARKRNAEATRAAILEAAKTQFAQLGYDRATLRAIAVQAGADVALIKRYFGGKEALFTSALEASFQSDFLGDWDRRTLAHEIATMMADNLYRDEQRVHRFQFLLRAAAYIGLLVERLIRNQPLSPKERAVFIKRTTAMLDTIIQA
jgi:AcrR family transcriptional regulator